MIVETFIVIYRFSIYWNSTSIRTLIVKGGKEEESLVFDVLASSVPARSSTHQIFSHVATD
jgi:hypothetical protein